MPGNNDAISYANTKKKFKTYAAARHKKLQEKWQGASSDDYPGKANIKTRLSYDEEKKVLSVRFVMKGQKMWTMEFGRGHSDQTGAGVSIDVINSPIFERYKKLNAFNKKGRLRSYYSRFKAAQRRRAKDKKNVKYKPQSYDKDLGGKAYNIVRIYTRKGAYHDIDGVTHHGSGIGGEYGLNTEAFAFHDGGYHEDESLARAPSPVISGQFGINELQMLDKAVWTFEDGGQNEVNLLTPLIEGVTADISKFLEETFKSK